MTDATDTLASDQKLLLEHVVYLIQWFQHMFQKKEMEFSTGIGIISHMSIPLINKIFRNSWFIWSKVSKNSFKTGIGIISPISIPRIKNEIFLTGNYFTNF